MESRDLMFLIFLPSFPYTLSLNFEMPRANHLNNNQLIKLFVFGKIVVNSQNFQNLLHVLLTTCFAKYNFYKLYVLPTTCSVNYKFCKLHVLPTTCSINYRFCKLSIQHVSTVQLLLIILSLRVQHVSPIQLLQVKVSIHKEFWLTMGLKWKMTLLRKKN